MLKEEFKDIFYTIVSIRNLISFKNIFFIINYITLIQISMLYSTYGSDKKSNKKSNTSTPTLNYKLRESHRELRQ
jgi:hypothetical protein